MRSQSDCNMQTLVQGSWMRRLCCFKFVCRECALLSQIMIYFIPYYTFFLEMLIGLLHLMTFSAFCILLAAFFPPRFLFSLSYKEIDFVFLKGAFLQLAFILSCQIFNLLVTYFKCFGCILISALIKPFGDPDRPEGIWYKQSCLLISTCIISNNLQFKVSQ